MWSRQPYHIGLRIQENTWFTCFFLSAGRRRPNMIGSIFLKNEKFSSSYPGVSNFSTNQNPAFYRCFQILGLGWGLQRPGKQGVCVVCFFCCDVLLAQAVLAPVELQNIVIVTNLCYIFRCCFLWFCKFGCIVTYVSPLSLHYRYLQCFYVLLPPVLCCITSFARIDRLLR